MIPREAEASLSLAAFLRRYRKTQLLQSLLTATLSIHLLTSCATMVEAPEGMRTLAEIVNLMSRDEILAREHLVEGFSAIGVQRSEIRDGSLARLRMFCCGVQTEKQHVLVALVPVDIDAKQGDVVEVASGRSWPFSPNRVTAIQERGDLRDRCRWMPDDASSLKRVLYCSGIEREGWMRYGEFETRAPEPLSLLWVKPPAGVDR